MATNQKAGGSSPSRRAIKKQPAALQRAVSLFPLRPISLSHRIMCEIRILSPFIKPIGLGYHQFRKELYIIRRKATVYHQCRRHCISSARRAVYHPPGAHRARNAKGLCRPLSACCRLHSVPRRNRCVLACAKTFFVKITFRLGEKLPLSSPKGLDITNAKRCISSHRRCVYHQFRKELYIIRRKATVYHQCRRHCISSARRAVYSPSTPSAEHPSARRRRAHPSVQRRLSREAVL